MAKVDVYQAVTDRIIEALDKGVVPWRLPFNRGGGNGMPRNLKSGKAYRGINVLLLGCTALSSGYESDYWLTFKQAREKGGQVRKGERSSLVVFWKQLDIKDKDSGKDKKVPMLRYYNVFNADQVDGIEAPDAVVIDPDADPVKPLEIARKVYANYTGAPPMQVGGARAAYSPLKDIVYMPEAARFESAERHASTLFHELAHSTGHTSRLNRDQDTFLAPFGSADYSREELTAEMAAAFLCAHNGISAATIEQAASYIDNWRRVLKADNKAVVKASGLAQRAVDHILGVTWDDAAAKPPATAADSTPAVIVTTTAEPDPYKPGHPWHYYSKGDHAKPITADAIPAAPGPFDFKLPKTKKTRDDKIAGLFQSISAELVTDTARYTDLVERGPEALSEYDRKIASNGDEELAWASAIANHYNGLTYIKGQLAALKELQGPKLFEIKPKPTPANDTTPPPAAAASGPQGGLFA